jgi:prolyl-tRNA editing enzyme YbaK/EbsC (Cys-tRNA(Pro) deacylase)
MHGDKAVDAARLAEQAGVPKIWSCSPADAEAMSGWPVGATNPFILKTSMPIYLESSVLDLQKIFINGGGRGCLVEMTPADLVGIVKPSLVRCAKDKAVVVSKAP